MNFNEVVKVIRWLRDQQEVEDPLIYIFKLLNDKRYVVHQWPLRHEMSERRAQYIIKVMKAYGFDTVADVVWHEQHGGIEQVSANLSTYCVDNKELEKPFLDEAGNSLEKKIEKIPHNYSNQESHHE